MVFNTLRQAILKGELAPGERLMEIQLAEKLGVSRTPIREAIRKLELEGLVLMIPRKGAEVARISEKSLRDVLEVRRSLEELAIELACQRMTEEELEELEQAQNGFQPAPLAGGDAMQIAETDEALPRYYLQQYRKRQAGADPKQPAGADVPLPPGIYQGRGQAADSPGGAQNRS